MDSPGNALIFDGIDYDYWKVHMRAYLLSLGSEVWEICEDPDYENLAVRATELHVRRHEAIARRTMLSSPISLALSSIV